MSNLNIEKIPYVDCNSTQTLVDCSIKLKERKCQVENATLYNKNVGSFRFLYTNRANIACGVEMISIFMDHPRLSHFLSAKRIEICEGHFSYRLLF